MPTELPKAYDPREAQAKWLAAWDDAGVSASDPEPAKTPFTIVIPPPNVTGALHMGHALNNTLQDVLTRWHRMRGDNALWVPGTDHAGIATQSVVEKRVWAEEKKTRRDLGRDELVKRIWQWKDQYETRILGQLREMGASCDWRRTRFTLDETCARAVRETFFRMFRDGYIYRGKRLVNWDTSLQTSVADDETYTEDTNGGFWTFKYPVDGVPETHIRFSTTRPETMLGDTAVCVHPSDERYKALVGKTVTLPLSGRSIPIIADGQLADPTLGTGCVKVTPAHDPNDYACWTRHPEIGIINILNPDGTINGEGGRFQGLPREQAREAVVSAMEELGYFEGREDRVIPLKYSDRSKTPIEPYLSDQWFVKMADRDDGRPGLAQMAMDAVTSGKVTFTPERYRETYLSWLGEKRDWCVSRQLWWGHRIPVWSKSFDSHADYEATLTAEAGGWSNAPHVAWSVQEESQTIHVCLQRDDAETVKALEADGFRQSEDVLDTWFSSALWPHSTLGWPERTPELQYYYPTSVLCTSRDIITLWVARMVLMGLYNVGDVPFRQVYIHPKVMDAFGDTMSKSRGNGVDPLDIIDRYGTDAMRYGVTALAGETQDSRMPVANVCPHCGTLVPLKKENTDPDITKRPKKATCPQCKQQFRPGGPWQDASDLPTARQASDRFEAGRNFANKLWNAARFILRSAEGFAPKPLDPAALPAEDRWILSRLATTTEAVTAALEGFRFAEVARLLYDFVWSEFCDWYIELCKARLTSDESRPVAVAVLLEVLDGTLRLAHPVMPFVTESLWHALNEAVPVRGLTSPSVAGEFCARAPWPSYPAAWRNAAAEAEFERMQGLVRGVREVRNRYQVEPKTKLALTVKASGPAGDGLRALAPFIESLAGLSALTVSADAARPRHSATLVRPELEAYVHLEGLVDPAAERKKLEKQLADARKQVAGFAAKLGNAKYVAGAPPEVVAETRAKAAEAEALAASLEQTLADFAE